MKRGLGMWIMSKLVILIFLFALVFVMSLFLRIYEDKVIADTARGYTTLWSEIAAGAGTYESSLETLYLEDKIQIQEVDAAYTLVLKPSEAVRQWRVAFLIAWKDHDSPEQIAQTDGFAAASVVSLPRQVERIIMFQGNYDDVGYETVEELLVRPSAPIGVGRDTNLIFYRNETVFCVGSTKARNPETVKDAIATLGACCTPRFRGTCGARRAAP
ncbi:MAG: hypothetical protein JW834_04140 [Candidatus Diapherotrites archaeon]|nr:hypothetical protein [Candidatus Diapherotrites archaeon]